MEITENSTKSQGKHENKNKKNGPGREVKNKKYNMTL